MRKNDLEANPLPSYIYIILIVRNYMFILAKQSLANAMEKQVICKPNARNANQTFLYYFGSEEHFLIITAMKITIKFSFDMFNNLKVRLIYVYFAPCQ